MKAIVHDEYGEADVLRLRELAAPTPGRGEVLVRVKAAGVDRGTWHLMAGLPLLVRLATGVRRPKQPILGRDLAGTVEAVGEGVTRFQLGDEVFGTAAGAFAEFVVAREDRLAHKPAVLSFDEAAAVPVSALTALQALREVGRVQAGEKVLVVGASGGVGTYAVQLAKFFGAEVTGVCSGSKAELVRRLGAAEVIDYAQQDLGTGQYDLILDIAGSRSVSQLRARLTPTGRLVIVGGEGGGRWLGGMERQLGAAALSPFVSHRLAFFVASEDAKGLEALADLAQRGAFRPAVDRTFPLERAAEALAYLTQGSVRGKVVVTHGERSTSLPA